MTPPKAIDSPIDILFVDSVRLFHQIITKIFTGTRLQPHFAESGAEALAAIEAGKFAIVCGALHLPDMTGIELCRRLRQFDKGKKLPFILLTANAPQAFIVDAYAAGVTDVFEKQSLGPLVTMLQRLLAHREPLAGRVLVVEDATAQAQFFATVLAQIGLNADIASSAEQALELLTTGTYDLVLMDILLAGYMSGVTLANQIRRLEGSRGEVPILAATAFDDLSRRIELFKLGIDDYVIKPVMAEELTARARNLIGHYRLLQQTRREYQSHEAEHQALAYRATHDLLTDLANRWLFEETLAEILQSPVAEHTALAYIDIGALRGVNDACGHEAGDALMREVGKRLQDHPARLIARFEGARLALLVQGDSSEARAVQVAQIRTNLGARPFAWQGREFNLPLAGVTLLSLAGIDSVKAALARIESSVS
ncbi:PleD family two-component system response regulator [Rhodocyclaceae bacterium]